MLTNNAPKQPLAASQLICSQPHARNSRLKTRFLQTYCDGVDRLKFQPRRGESLKAQGPSPGSERPFLEDVNNARYCFRFVPAAPKIGEGAAVYKTPFVFLGCRFSFFGFSGLAKGSGSRAHGRSRSKARPHANLPTSNFEPFTSPLSPVPEHWSLVAVHRALITEH